MQLEIARDWLDYVEASGILLSLILAGGALIYAKRSADAASGSAAAAETTAAAATQEAQQTRELVRLARDQHARLVREANRRPRFAVPRLAFLGALDPADLTIDELKNLVLLDWDLDDEVRLWLPIVRTTFENLGDRAADQVLARLLVPADVLIRRAGPDGGHREEVDLHPADEKLARRGSEISAHAHAWRIPHLPPNQPESLHAVLVLPAPGDYEVELQLAHEEAEQVRQRFVIEIAQDGSGAALPS